MVRTPIQITFNIAATDQANLKAKLTIAQHLGCCLIIANSSRPSENRRMSGEKLPFIAHLAGPDKRFRVTGALRVCPRYPDGLVPSIEGRTHPWELAVAIPARSMNKNRIFISWGE